MKLLLCLLLIGCATDDDVEDTATADEALSVAKVERINTISYAPNSFVIGNAYPGWTDLIQGDPQFSHGAGNEAGANYRWGYLFGEHFDHCAWVNNKDVAQGPHNNGARCGNPQQIDTPHFLATYTNGDHNSLAGDGSETHMHYAGSGCTEHRGFGNVEPWRVPATPGNVVGTIPDGKLLRWRYVTKDGDWVLVRDPAPLPNEPNWYFVHRGCVSIANTD